MAATISVPFTIVNQDDMIAESWSPDAGAQAVVKFKCLWTDRYQLVKDLVGTYVGTPPSTIVRVAPYQYPDSPNLRCVGIDSIVPFGSPIPWPKLGLPWMARDHAIVTARFGVLHWDFSGPDAYTRITFGSSAEFLTVPETTTIFASDSSPTGSSIGILIPQMEITVERNRMPFLPIFAMQSCQGKVNSAAYEIGGVAFAAGYLLFGPGRSNYQNDATGNIAYSQEYRFIYRSVQWNKFLRPDGTGFDSVTDRGGNPVYGSADFTVLP